MSRVSTTLAIIGCGPKGLYALDSLCEAAREAHFRRFEVHIFEPAPCPGAGPIYDPSQPKFLLMNFPAHLVDAWIKRRGPSLMEWLTDRGATVQHHRYLPRAVIGQYLHWCFHRIIRDAPRNLKISLHASSVSALRRKRDSWLISPANISVDEVLVTTGHQDWARNAVPARNAAIASPFPVQSVLTQTTVPAGARVACKGFALTFIDTVLALTKGRGGVFSKTASGYRYQPSGAEPALIAPFSRTGRPMRAKVVPDQFVPPQNDRFWEEHLRTFDETISSVSCASFGQIIWPTLLQISDALLDLQPGTTSASFEDWCKVAFTAERCQAELHKGYEIATGVAAPDSLWALAEAWRRSYPKLVAWISHRELAPDDAMTFRSIAAEMERLAFGPPAQNVGKILCLEDSGLISFDYLSRAYPSDVLINATIPPAGSAALSEPLSDLLQQGHVRVGSLGGLRVNAEAQAIGNGGVTPGLSLIGRPTEGSVLGNDTLSRNLHDLPERWAARIASPVAVRIAERRGLSA